MIRGGEDLPFDVADLRAIRFDLTDPDSVEAAKTELTTQMQSGLADPGWSTNPIAASLEIRLLRESPLVDDQTHAEMLSILEEVRSAVGEIAVGASRRTALWANAPWQESLSEEFAAELAKRPQTTILYRVLGVPSHEITDLARLLDRVPLVARVDLDVHDDAIPHGTALHSK